MTTELETEPVDVEANALTAIPGDRRRVSEDQRVSRLCDWSCRLGKAAESRLSSSAQPERR